MIGHGFRALAMSTIKERRGYPVRNVLAVRRVEELARINGDLGRPGGQLKFLLTADARTAVFGGPTIGAVLPKIVDTQEAMHEVMLHVVCPQSIRLALIAEVLNSRRNLVQLWLVADECTLFNSQPPFSTHDHAQFFFCRELSRFRPDTKNRGTPVNDVLWMEQRR